MEPSRRFSTWCMHTLSTNTVDTMSNRIVFVREENMRGGRGVWGFNLMFLRVWLLQIGVDTKLEARGSARAWLGSKVGQAKP